MTADIAAYHDTFSTEEAHTCRFLATALTEALPEASAKIWHAHPVWFLDGNPVAGYSKRKAGIHLLFWSGQSFEEAGLRAEGSFQAAGLYLKPGETPDPEDLSRWIAKSRDIQWDYANIVKRKGRLERLK